MNTYTQILYHVVFATKFRQPVLLDIKKREILYAYIGRLILNRNSKPIIINGVEDHLHLLFNLHPSQNLSDVVKEIKLASSRFILTERIFPAFTNWQNGYAAFTVSNYNMHKLVTYIKNQVIHHQRENPRKELERILNFHNITWNPDYLD